MADYPALQLWTDAYLADTTDLSAEEHGVYLLLLMAAWRTPKCALPDDDARLARMCRIGLKKWRNIRPVMERFWTVDARGWTQKRLLKERERSDNYRSQKSLAGKASALKRNDTASTGVGTEQATASQPPEPLPNKDSVPNGTGAVRAVDPAKLVFDAGVKWLGSYGKTARDARALVGKWRKRCRDPDLLALFAEAGSKERSDPVEYIEGALRNGKADQTQSGGSAERVARVVASLRQPGSEGVADSGGNADAVLPAVSGGGR